MAKVELKRNATKVHAHLVEDGDALVTTKACTMTFPNRWVDKNLAEIGETTYVAGYFCLINEDGFYTVNSACAMVPTAPSSISIVDKDGVEYIEFGYEPGDTVIVNLNLAKNPKLTYYVFNEFLAMVNIPWYFNYIDLINLFKSCRKHADVTLSKRITILSMLVTLVARDPSNLNEYFRRSIKNFSDSEVSRPHWVGLRSTTHGATNTTARLGGNNFDNNLTAALVNPTERSEPFEQLLRS